MIVYENSCRQSYMNPIRHDKLACILVFMIISMLLELAFILDLPKLERFLFVFELCYDPITWLWLDCFILYQLSV